MICARAIAALLVASTATFTLPCDAQNGGLTCSSEDGEYHYCRADTQNQVELVRKLSSARCEQGKSWGFDPRGIWVDRGCRARFSYGRSNDGNSDSDHTTAVIAGGILGAMIMGAAIASANSQSDGNNERVNYYNDGYRMGRQDADNGRPNFPGWWNDRRPAEYARDFDAGYSDGYNNYGRRPPR
jgi:hypothetical protein